MHTNTELNPIGTCPSIKLGFDDHARRFCVGRHLDGAIPQPVRKIVTIPRLLFE